MADNILPQSTATLLREDLERILSKGWNGNVRFDVISADKEKNFSYSLRADGDTFLEAMKPTVQSFREEIAAYDLATPEGRVAALDLFGEISKKVRDMGALTPDLDVSAVERHLASLVYRKRAQMIEASAGAAPPYPRYALLRRSRRFGGPVALGLAAGLAAGLAGVAGGTFYAFSHL